MIECSLFFIYSFRCLIFQFLVQMYVSFDTFNDSVHLARCVAPEQRRRSDFDGSTPRIGCKDVCSPWWLMIRRPWAMLLPLSIAPRSVYFMPAAEAEKWSC